VDPVTMVAAAVAAGAATGLGRGAEQAVGDAYQALKQLLTGRYRSVQSEVEVVEQQPESPEPRAALAGELRRTGADTDEELLAAAGRMLVEVFHHAPQSAATVGVRLEQVSAGEVAISDITTTGPGTAVSIEDVRVDGTVTISGVHADAERPPHPLTAQQ